MNKTKILFCIENVRQGGISKALESIIPVLESPDFEISIFCINSKDGPYHNVFKKYIKENDGWFLYALSTYYTEHKGIKKIWLLFIKIIAKALKRAFKINLLALALRQKAKKISREKYDVVIAFSEGIITHFCTNIEAKKKIAWIHLDYKRYLSYNNNNIDETNAFSHYDHIVIPSKHCSRSFIDIFPQYTDKVEVIPNIVNSNQIQELSLIDDKLDKRFIFDDCFTIISVGRICYEKRFFEIPQIAKELFKKGLKFRWYIIGNGSEKETQYLVEQIRLHKVKETVILLGAKENPYPYIRHSNLLAVTSISETFCYAIAEAKVLGVPVITTNFGTSYEVVDKTHGVICELNDFKDNISELYLNIEKYNQLKRELEDCKHPADNRAIIRLLKAE